jgi:tetratricopeptide (TPR) repeat protein
VGKGRLGEAVAEYREALRLKKDYPDAHVNLGDALVAQGRAREAEAAFREAIRLKRDDPNAHYGLGNALREQGDLPGASAAFRKAIALAPGHAEAHCNLGQVLRRQGEFRQALAALRRGHELGMKNPGWRYPSAAWVRKAEFLASLEGKLLAFLKGEFQPKDAAERLNLAAVSHAKRLHHAAARLLADAFVIDPKLAGNLKGGHRYGAACSAALAAAGKGADAGKLDDKDKARLRQQALNWLRADLALHARQVETAKPADRAAVQQALRHWQKDTDLAGLREAAALKKLPAAEREAFAQLWADVAALVKRVEENTK